MSPKFQRFLQISFLVAVAVGMLAIADTLIVMNFTGKELVSELQAMGAFAVTLLSVFALVIVSQVGKGLPGYRFRLYQGEPLKALYKEVIGTGEKMEIFLVLKVVDSDDRVTYQGPASFFSTTNFPEYFMLTREGETYLVREVLLNVHHHHSRASSESLPSTDEVGASAT